MSWDATDWNVKEEEQKVTTSPISSYSLLTSPHPYMCMFSSIVCLQGFAFNVLTTNTTILTATTPIYLQNFCRYSEITGINPIELGILLNMSFKNFLLLLLLLLCLSLRACSARRIGTHHRKLEKKIHISNQKDQKGLSVTLPSKNDHAGAATEDRIVETQVDSPTQNRKESKATATQMPIEDKKAAVQKESVVSFSWRVPRNKQKEKYPGFDSDYSPPKTHPPSHN